MLSNFTFNNFGLMGSDNSSILAMTGNYTYNTGTITLKCYKWTEKVMILLLTYTLII